MNKQAIECPVCGGNGLVTNGFYLQLSGKWSTSDATPENCRSCSGRGYIVVKDEENKNIDENNVKIDAEINRILKMLHSLSVIYGIDFFLKDTPLGFMYMSEIKKLQESKK